VCENNLYNEYTPYRETTAGSLTARAAAFGMPALEIDGQDIRLVYKTALQLVQRARQGDGPAFFMCNTYRYYGHHVGDINRDYYRSKEEEQAWKTERDPLNLLAGWLTSALGLKTEIFNDIEQKAAAEIEAGVEFALRAPYPDAEEVSLHVYA
jgi:pyruvate dehydrogenase E1 component alpha subunit